MSSESASRETLADIERMKYFDGYFTKAITTLDQRCEQIKKEAKRSRTLAGKFVQPTFAEHEYAKRWASVYSVVWSTRFEHAFDASLEPMTMDAISCVETEANEHVNSDDEPECSGLRQAGCSGMRQAFRSAPTKTLTVSATVSQQLERF